MVRYFVNHLLMLYNVVLTCALSNRTYIVTFVLLDVKAVPILDRNACIKICLLNRVNIIQDQLN